MSVNEPKLAPTGLSKLMENIQHIITMLVVSGIVWLVGQTQDIVERLITIEASVETQVEIDQSRERLLRSEITNMEQRASILVEQMRTQLSEQRAKIDRLNSNDDNQWPRLRALGANVSKLEQQLELLCTRTGESCNIDLNGPERF